MRPRPTTISVMTAPNKKNCAGAFTLIELILVIAVIAVFAGLAYPRLSNAVAGFQSQRFVRNIYDFSFYLQSSAIVERKMYCLVFDQENAKVWAMRKDEEGFKKPVGKLGFIYVAPQGLRLRAEEGVSSLYFYPDGSTDQARIIFESKDGDKSAIIFEGAGGGIQIK